MKTLTIDVAAVVGDRVYVPALECHAHVYEVSIGRLDVAYGIAWFHNGERNTAYLTRHEFRPTPDDD